MAHKVQLQDGTVVKYDSQAGSVRIESDGVIETHHGGFLAHLFGKTAEDKLDEAIKKHGPIVKHL